MVELAILLVEDRIALIGPLYASYHARPVVQRPVGHVRAGRSAQPDPDGRARPVAALWSRVCSTRCPRSRHACILLLRGVATDGKQKHDACELIYPVTHCESPLTS